MYPIPPIDIGILVDVQIYLIRNPPNEIIDRMKDGENPWLAQLINEFEERSNDPEDIRQTSTLVYRSTQILFERNGLVFPFVRAKTIKEIVEDYNPLSNEEKLRIKLQTHQTSLLNCIINHETDRLDKYSSFLGALMYYLIEQGYCWDLKVEKEKMIADENFERAGVLQKQINALES